MNGLKFSYKKNRSGSVSTLKNFKGNAYTFVGGNFIKIVFVSHLKCGPI